MGITNLEEIPQSQDIWSTRTYVVGEILISLVVLIGSGAVLFLHPSDLFASAALTAIPVIIVFWFQRRASEQATTSVKEATNGAIKALSDKVDQINSQGTYGSTQHILQLQQELQQIALSNQARIGTLETDSAEKKSSGSV